MVHLINRATRKLDIWAMRYPFRVLLFMSALALVVIAVSNMPFMRGDL